MKSTWRALQARLNAVRRSVGEVAREVLDSAREPPMRRDHYEQLATSILDSRHRITYKVHSVAASSHVVEGRVKFTGSKVEVEPREVVYHDDQLRAFASSQAHQLALALIVYFLLCLGIILRGLKCVNTIPKKK